MTDVDELITRYVAIWNEPDEARRGERIPGIWSEKTSLYNRLREYRGHVGIEQATKRSYDLFGSRGFSFRPRGEAIAHHGAVRFTWEMLNPERAVDSVGTQFLMLDDRGLILLDYQFIEPSPTLTPERDDERRA